MEDSNSPDQADSAPPEPLAPEVQATQMFVFSEFAKSDRDARSAAAQRGTRVVIGRARLTSGELSQLRSGSVVVLEDAVDDPVEVLSDDTLIARGDLVVVDSALGVRIRDRLENEGTIGKMRRAS